MKKIKKLFKNVKEKLTVMGKADRYVLPIIIWGRK